MTLSESRLRVGLSLSTPPLLLALALIVWTGGVSGWVAGGLVLVSLISGWFVLFDFAISIILDTHGIIRRCLARDHVIEWTAIDRITRRPRRGLVLVTGDGEHHILIDRKLDDSEFDSFVTRVRARGVEIQG